MPRVSIKNEKQNNYTVSTPHHQKNVTQLLSRFSGVKSLIRFEPFNHWYLYFFWER